MFKNEGFGEDREDGFSLVELLVVIVIIGILSAIAIGAFLNQRKKANDASAQADLDTIRTAAATTQVEHPNATVSGSDWNANTGLEITTTASEAPVGQMGMFSAASATTGTTTTDRISMSNGVIGAAGYVAPGHYKISTVHTNGTKCFTWDSKTGKTDDYAIDNAATSGECDIASGNAIDQGVDDSGNTPSKPTPPPGKEDAPGTPAAENLDPGVDPANPETPGEGVEDAFIAAPTFTNTCEFKQGVIGLGARVRIHWEAPEGYTVDDIQVSASDAGLGSSLSPLANFDLKNRTITNSDGSYRTDIPTNLLGGRLGMGSELEIAFTTVDGELVSEKASVATNAGLIGGVGAGCRNL